MNKELIKKIIDILEFYTGRDKLLHGIELYSTNGPAFDSPIYKHYYKSKHILKILENKLNPNNGDRRLDDKQGVFEFFNRRA